MHRKAVVVSSLLLGVLLTGIPICQGFAPMTAYASEVNQVADVSFDSELSLVVIKPKQTGTTYFSYKVNEQYPTYANDKVYFFNADGSLKEEKNGMLGQTIFTDDISTWIDVTKTIPNLDTDTEYYDKLLLADGDIVLPYSEANDTNEFYIPVTEIGAKVTVSVVNVAEDGTVSEVISNDFNFLGVQQNEEVKINASIVSVKKTANSEIVRISGDNISYIQLGRDTYKATGNSVDIELTSNGERSFHVYGADSAIPEVLTYTVEGLTGYVDEEIEDEKVDKTAPIITHDKVPTEEQPTAIKFKVYTDEKSIISCNGLSSEGTELELNIAGNGTYLVTATDMSGNYSELTITFDCFTDYVRDDYVLDNRDNLWGEDETPEGKLPQTGENAAGIAIGVATLMTGIGTALIVYGSKRRGDNLND